MRRFDHDLEYLQQRLREMGDLARSMVGLAANAVRDRTKDVFDDMAALESRLNRMQMEIDHHAIRMLTVYGPVAADLRYVLVATHMTSQLERMGDQAMNVCESLRLMTSDPQQHPMLSKVQKMGELVCGMVDDALDAFFTRNVEKAILTRSHDDMVDALNEQIMKELLTDDVLREVLEGARGIADAVAQILIARYLERTADQATNICKEVIYMVRGDDVRHTPKGPRADSGSP
jgi:phosphate transport system protein